MDYFNYVVTMPAVFLGVSLILAYCKMEYLKEEPNESLFWKRVDYAWFAISTITFITAVFAGYKLLLTQEIEFEKSMRIYSIDMIRADVGNAYNEVCIKTLLSHVAGSGHKAASMNNSKIADCHEILQLYPIVFKQALAEANENQFQVSDLEKFINRPLSKNSELLPLQDRLKSDLKGYSSHQSNIVKLLDEAGYMKSPLWSTAFIMSLWLTALALGFRLVKVHAESVIEKRKLIQH